MDRYEARRRRRRRQGRRRLAVLTAAVALVVIVIVLVTRGCGGGDDAGRQQGTSAGDTPTGKAGATPKPVPTQPALVSLGDTVRFKTPEGAVVRVKASAYRDPGQPPAGVSADTGERLVTLKLTVTAEGPAGTAAVPLPFASADSFLLVMENDELAGGRLAGDGLFGGSLEPGKSRTSTIAFSVGDSPPLRFVCRPVADSVPASATWKLE